MPPDNTHVGGVLAGVRVIELAGIGPTPLAGMVLAGMGAEVVRIARPGQAVMAGHEILNRSRVNVEVDLKDRDHRTSVIDLVRHADALVEGYRPGVLERLGLGPDVLLDANPSLVIGRMTGWGQSGPWAHAAGHDINYIALTGALAATGRAGAPPTVPLNLVGDFGGGAMFLVAGVLAGILHARAGGDGQVVDAAMVDGVSNLMAMFHDLSQAGLHSEQRGTNLLDSGAWFYDVYECADGKWISLGPIEPAFRAELFDRLGLDHDFAPDGTSGDDPAAWPEHKARLAAVIATQPRAHWDDLLAGTDACYAPVLGLGDVAAHPHMAARDVIVDVEGSDQPAPAPRFCTTPSPEPTTGTSLTPDELLAAWDNVD